MSSGVNYYKADLRNLDFTLYEHLHVEQLFELPAFSHLSRAECDAMMKESYKFATTVSGPINGSGDRQQCRLEGGRVKTPDGFAAAWKQFYALGIPAFPMPQEWEGLGGPISIYLALEEMITGSNTSFNMYPGLSHGAGALIAELALPEQKKRFVPHIVSGRFSGTMCLSEPHAGSDVGATRTKAVPSGDGTYAITGTKCWISCGDNDFVENTIHLVLARVEGAPAGTKGLSLFIVPRVWVNEDGSLGADNDVQVGSIEHKMGINASATCVLNFGEAGKCKGLLVGGIENHGMSQMFHMMNGARIGVAMQGVALASTAYLNALHYAKERQQGPSVKNFKDANAPRVPIIQHSDVRRMLLEMKSKVEGMRALLIKLALHIDLADAYAKTDEKKAAYHQGQADLMVSLSKSYCSDQSFRIAELAIQVHGGVGYTRDFPVEQYCRDAKIFSIYEGTNHIQALDLVSRQLQRGNGGNFMAYMKDVGDLVARLSGSAALGAEAKAIGEAQKGLQEAAMQLMQWGMGGKLEQVTGVANYFLETMAELTIATLSLEAAEIAQAKLDAGGLPQSEQDFYAGKVASCRFYVWNVLPMGAARVAMIKKGDRSALDVPDAAFARY